MQNEDGIVDLRVILEGDSAKQFLKIKQKKGLTQNTEVIRTIINDFYNEHFQEA
jgi:hypothetical protein